MAIYSVDVKAFLRCNVEAPSAAAAEAEAKAFVEGLDPSAAYVAGWSETRASEGTARGRLIETGSIDCEDPAYIEGEDGNEIDPDEETATPTAA